VHGFIILILRLGIEHDTAAGLNVELAILDNGRPQGDARIEVAVPSEISHRASINAAARGLQFIDDLHGADFGGA
jgi:hypothetical protein